MKLPTAELWGITIKINSDSYLSDFLNTKYPTDNKLPIANAVLKPGTS